MIRIGDVNDPRIAAYRQVRERDLVGRQGLFVAEGEVVLRMLTRSPLMETVSWLIAEKRWEGLSELAADLSGDVPVYLASQSVMDAVAGFPIHRGILALGRRRIVATGHGLLASLPDRALVLAACRIANHDNMGGLFRNAAAFGVDAVLVDSDCCDPLYRKAIRVSVGAALLTPYARLERGEDLIALLRGAGFSLVAMSPQGSTQLADLQGSSRTAILVGAEGPGLSQAYLEPSQTVAIRMATGFDSLNLSTTTGIVLHHLKFVARD